MKISNSEIRAMLKFSEKFDEACDTIQEGAGCNNCPCTIRQTGCLTATPIDEVWCIDEELWQEFFDFADDVSARACLMEEPDRSDYEER